MNAKAGFQSGLGETDDIAAVGRTFQPMKHDNLALGILGLVFVGNNSDVWSHLVFDAARRVGQFVNLTTPVIASDGCDMRIVEERKKIGSQFLILDAALPNDNRFSSCDLDLRRG